MAFASIRAGLSVMHARHPAAVRLLRHGLDALAVMWVAVTLAFLTMQLVPGDPIDRLVADDQGADEAVRAQIAAFYGLDQPVHVQYAVLVSRYLTGDFGISYQRQLPVLEVFASEVGATLELTLATMGFALSLAFFIALVTSGQNRVSRAVAQATELVAVSLPSFWLGLLLLTAFSFQLNWFPAYGANDARALVLPALTLAIPIAGLLAQILRERMESVLQQPFVVTIRARGVGEGRLRLAHVLKHASLPVLTLIGVVVANILSGTVIVETIFGRPGIGRIALQAVLLRDIPVVMGMVVLSALIFVVVNMVIELVYPWIDPRLKHTS